MTDLHIVQLTLTDFRNYAKLRLEPQPGLNVLAGSNGAGKTNLLEAISLLAPGRGLRRAPYAELMREGGAGRWAVAARVDGRHGEVRIGTEWSASAESSARRVSVDGEVQRGTGALASCFSVLWLTPAMDRIFAGPAGDRRRFLDRLVLAFDPEHGPRTAAYEKLMRERNRLLESPPFDAAWLAGVESQMAESGVAIAAARSEAVRALDAYMRSGETSSEAPFPWAGLMLEGELERDLETLSAVEVEDRYRRMLNDSRAQDAHAGRTLSGPHRSDLQVTHGPKGVPAARCSTGEQKALLVSTVLAHARFLAGLDGGTTPVLLLDEIAAHLDRTRRAALFEVLAALGTQVWMTGTELDLFVEIGAVAGFYRVDNGSLSAA